MVLIYCTNNKHQQRGTLWETCLILIKSILMYFGLPLYAHAVLFITSRLTENKGWISDVVKVLRFRGTSQGNFIELNGHPR